MSARLKQFSSAFRALRKLILPVSVSFLPLLIAAERFLLAGELPRGKVVWWGFDAFWEKSYSAHTNGVIGEGDDLLTNIIGVAAHQLGGMALKVDGTVVAVGRGSEEEANVPAGLTNVISIAWEGNSWWAIKREGTVARWGNDHDKADITGGLRNVKSIVWAGYRSYLALLRDGTVLGFQLHGSEEPSGSGEHRALPVRVGGHLLTNVMGLASMGYTPIVLKMDGTVFSLGYETPGEPLPDPIFTKIDEQTLAVGMGGESERTPYEYTAAHPVTIAASHWVGSQTWLLAGPIRWHYLRTAPSFPGVGTRQLRPRV